MMVLWSFAPALLSMLLPSMCGVYVHVYTVHVHVQCTLYVCVGMLYIIVSFVACMCTCAFTTVYSHSSNMYLPLLLSCPYWRLFPFHLYIHVHVHFCTMYMYMYVAYVPCVHEKCMYMYMYKLISSLSPHSRKFPHLVHMHVHMPPFIPFSPTTGVVGDTLTAHGSWPFYLTGGVFASTLGLCVRRLRGVTVASLGAVSHVEYYHDYTKSDTMYMYVDCTPHIAWLLCTCTMYMYMYSVYIHVHVYTVFFPYQSGALLSVITLVVLNNPDAMFYIIFFPFVPLPAPIVSVCVRVCVCVACRCTVCTCTCIHGTLCNMHMCSTCQTQSIRQTCFTHRENVL